MSENKVGSAQSWFTRNKVIMVVAIAMSTFQLYTSIFGTLEAMYQRQIHLLFASTLAILIAPSLKAKRKGTIWEDRIAPIDLLWILVGIVCLGYLLINHDYYVGVRLGYVTPLTLGEKLLAIGIMALVLESARRVTGPPLVVVALCFLAYVWIGPILPGILNHSGFSVDMLLDVEVLLTDGIFSTPLAVSATYVFTFIAMNAFLEQAGFGELLMALAQSVAGKARGGPAKVAVVASCLFGMISGSGNANVVATGTFTIPMMKRLGFAPEFAGAVEAAASTGG